jgi:hypothetical protein
MFVKEWYCKWFGMVRCFIRFKFDVIGFTFPFTTERVMRWRSILEGYGPELIYLPGDKNIVPDAISCLGFNPIDQHSQYADCFGVSKDDLPIDIYPVKHSTFLRAKKQDNHLHRMLQMVQFKTFRGGEMDQTLICYKDKIVFAK